MYINEIKRYLQNIPWATAKQFTTEAEILAKKHITLVQYVLQYRSSAVGGSQLEAYSDAQSAGSAADGHLDFLRMLYKSINYRSTPAKEPLILTISSYFYWEKDPELRRLENPWASLMRLYELGYTSTFDEDEEIGKLSIIIEYTGGQKIYTLVDGYNNVNGRNL